MMNALYFVRSAFHCAIRRKWRAALMYLRTARACMGRPPF
jgi:hypothetical protein